MLTQAQKQDFFNRAVAGLASQGFKKAQAFDDCGNVIACVYRAADGKKCALGHLIPDDKYEPSMEGGTNYFKVFPAIGLAWNQDTRSVFGLSEEELFLGSKGLQGCHDDAKSPNDMKDRLNEFGVAQGLDIPAVLLDDA